MNSVVIVIIAMGLFYFVGYRFWSRLLADKVFQISDSERTPAHNPALRDDVDYVPTRKAVLWGHHYASVAGAAPIIGPAVAVFWGWLPALLWVVFGTIFIGAVHDFGALVLSARKDGHTMADIAGDLIHPRVRLLFQIIIYFLIWVVLAVFGFAIGVLFDQYPAAVIPVNFQIIVALAIGFTLHRKGKNILLPSIIALLLLYAMIPVGVEFQSLVQLNLLTGETGPGVHIQAVTWWAIILIVYSAVASVLPVWMLLQPRDYINSHQLIVGLALLVLGLFVLHPDMAAPAINPEPTGAPPLLPLLFVTIACGAISGFHGLVSSGTSSKQMDKMSDARAIGYGGMLGEGMLAVIATVAVAAGLENWGEHYHSWNESGIRAIANFVAGAANFVDALPGFTLAFGQALVAILAISFAATSMDTAARIQRFIVSEAGSAMGMHWLKNRYLATAVAVFPAIPLVMAGKEVWGPLWLLFGTTNQLIGGMTLLILFVYLFRTRRPVMHFAIPMVFVVLMTTAAMVYNLVVWIGQQGIGGANWFTVVLAAVILLLEIWMIAEAVIILKKLRREQQAEAIEEQAA